MQFMLFEVDWVSVAHESTPITAFNANFGPLTELTSIEGAHDAR